MPLKAEELEAEGLKQFPATIGGVVLVVSVDSVTLGLLRLTGDVLADIYLGKVSKRNDPEINSR